jgi:hypothetical protein
MNKKSKIFFWVLIILTLLSIFFTFNRSFISKNYEITPIDSDAIENIE